MTQENRPSPAITAITRIHPGVLVPLVVLIAYASQFQFDSNSPSGLAWGIRLFVVVFPVTWLMAYLESRSPELKAVETPLPDMSPRPASSPLERLREQPQRTFWATLALVAMIVSAIQARKLESNLAAALLWLAGLILFLAACWPGKWQPDLARWKETLRLHWGEVLLAVVVIGAGMFVRFYRLDLPPVGMEQDAANFGVDALKLLHGDKLYFFATSWFFDTPAVYTFLHAAAMTVFGKDAIGLGIVSATLGSLNLLLLYLLARRMFGSGMAVVAVVLMAVGPYHLYYSRTGENNLVVPVSLTAVLYFLYRGLHSRRAYDYALAGVSLGIGLWWDYNNKSVQLLPMLGVAMGFMILSRWRYWRSEYAKLGLFLAGAVMVLLPVWSAYAHTDKLRMDFAHGRFVFENLEREAGRYGTSNPWLIVAHQVEYSVFGLNHYGAGMISPVAGPMLDSLTAVFFFIGLAYSVWRWKDLRYGMVLLCWVVGLQASIWSIDPPYAHRLIIILIPTYLMAAIGMVKMGQLWARLLNWNRGIYLGMIAALLLGNIVYTNLNYFFSDKNYPLDWLETADAGRAILTYSADHDVYYVAAPRIYTGHGTITFYSQLLSLSATGVEDIASVAPLKKRATRDLAFVLAIGRDKDLEYLKRYYPNGTLKEWYDDRYQTVYLKAYLVSQAEANASAAGSP